MRKVLGLIALALLVCSAQLTFATGSVTVSPILVGGSLSNFEGFAEGTIITNQYPGVVFGQQDGGTPIIDNYPWLFGYGASSGSGVLTGSTNGGAPFPTVAGLLATFTSPVSNVQFFFSDTAPLGDYTFSAYDSLNNLLGTVTILQCCTLPPGYSGGIFPPPGTTPLPGLYVSFIDATADIAYITIGPSSAFPGDSFAIDDLLFNGTIPEPASLLLLGGGLLGASRLLRKHR